MMGGYTMNEPMNLAETIPNRAAPEPLPENIRSVQPGGGVCCQIELLWGRWRRWWLTHFRPGYVARMAALRQGDRQDAPHEILDPRDLKYCRNRCGYWWAEADDPFRWRGRLPFARWGLAELQLMGWPLAAADRAGRVFLLVPGAAARGGAGVGRVFLPRSAAASAAGAGAGRLARRRHGGRNDALGARRVHRRAGRADRHLPLDLQRPSQPCPAGVPRAGPAYAPGEFLNALRPESALRNENMWIGLEEESPPHRRLVVRQISGAIARRIVCDLRPGEVLGRGREVRHDQAGLADRIDPPGRSGTFPRRGRRPPRAGRHDRAGAICKRCRTTDSSPSP